MSHSWPRVQTEKTGITIKDHSSHWGFQPWLPVLLYFTGILFNIHSYFKPSPFSTNISTWSWQVIWSFISKRKYQSMRISLISYQQTYTFASTYLFSFFTPVIMEKLSFLIFKVSPHHCVQIPFNTVRNLTLHLFSSIS